MKAGKLRIDKEVLESLYVKQRLSSRKISKIYGCAYSTIDNKIRSFGFPRKTLAAAHVLTKRRPFDGSPNDKAYLIGFRIGDLRVRKVYKNSETLLIDCGSTHQAQIDLIGSLFKKYGRVWVSKPGNNKKKQIECGVDLSFSFLLPKFLLFPEWTLKRDSLFMSILAGFIDAEGCFYLSKNKKRSVFSIGNYNFEILRQIQDKLRNKGFTTRISMGVKKGYKGKDGYVHRSDYWMLFMWRKLELLKFSHSILPYLRHREKIEDVDKIIESITWRNKIYG